MSFELKRRGAIGVNISLTTHFRAHNPIPHDRTTRGARITRGRSRLQPHKTTHTRTTPRKKQRRARERGKKKNNDDHDEEKGKGDSSTLGTLKLAELLAKSFISQERFEAESDNEGAKAEP